MWSVVMLWLVQLGVMGDVCLREGSGREMVLSSTDICTVPQVAPQWCRLNSSTGARYSSGAGAFGGNMLYDAGTMERETPIV